MRHPSSDVWCTDIATSDWWRLTGCLPSSMPTTHPPDKVVWSCLSNQVVTGRTGLSSIGDIMSCCCLGLFGHVAQLDSGVPARDALECAYACCTCTKIHRLSAEDHLDVQGRLGCTRLVMLWYVVLWKRKCARSILWAYLQLMHGCNVSYLTDYIL